MTSPLVRSPPSEGGPSFVWPPSRVLNLSALLQVFFGQGQAAFPQCLLVILVLKSGLDDAGGWMRLIKKQCDALAKNW